MDKRFDAAAGTARDIRQAVAAGLPPAAVARALIERVARIEPAVGAYAHFDADALMRQAEDLPEGPLRGVPVAIKDVLLTRDMPTGHNSPRYGGSRPGIDAACVDTLRGAGALIAGKATTTEFASTTVGPGTRNPHDPNRTPGGSSSGSAAAVAAGLATLAIGTQTGGSTIRPASFCGVFGMKPTWNAISREGSKMYSATCDTVGLYARAAADFEMLADLFRFDECALPTTLQGLRIGITYGTTPHAADSDTRAAMDAAAAALRDAGAILSDLVLPAGFDGILDAHRTILAREGASAFLNEVRNTPGIDAFFAKMVDGDRPGPSEARAAYAQADLCRALLDGMFASALDLILTPSAPGAAPEGTHAGDPIFNSMWTLMQVPVVVVPFHKTPQGLPVGVSLVGRRYDDRKVIRAASLLMPETVPPVG
ncbi:amidase [Paracoccus sp. 1_MG-2023]|uniref:amidase family protein n=1 Tax=unclassified Paracoccus (in: a-proteobacteria) TaxID=2688777 RepID=UPI001C099917|nr:MULTISPECIES: amidase [unclassified Paracoccus (in: a-proteobacteria)]MBU2957635.1 amidase [Paracoccus sp. C2R09]MDO6667518.1 amidase [Paracoccus sp. 1_MG-2023]